MSDRKAQIRSVLKPLQIFSNLSEEALEELAGFLKEKSYKVGEYLYRQSTPRRAMFIVKSGKVEIVRGTGDKQDQIAMITEGNFVGESAILDSTPHNSSCKAVEDTVAYELTNEALDEFFIANPKGGRYLLTEIARGIALRLEYVSFGYRGADSDILSSGDSL